MMKSSYSNFFAPNCPKCKKPMKVHGSLYTGNLYDMACTCTNHKCINSAEYKYFVNSPGSWLKSGIYRESTSDKKFLLKELNGFTGKFLK